MKLHPLADAFPRMPAQDFEDLKRDIGENGLTDKIVTFEGTILDGRHRYDAISQLRDEGVVIDWVYEEYAGTTPAFFVLSKNLRRRHMTPTDRAMVVAHKSIREGVERERSAHIGAAGGRGDRSVSRDTDQTPELGRTREILGDMAGLGHATVGRAIAVMHAAEEGDEEAVELVEQIKAGETSVHAAATQLAEKRRANGEPKRSAGARPRMDPAKEELTQAKKDWGRRIAEAIDICDRHLLEVPPDTFLASISGARKKRLRDDVFPRLIAWFQTAERELQGES